MELLDNVLGSALQSRASNMSPIAMALLGVLAYRALKGQGRLADLPRDQPDGANPFGGNAGAPDPRAAGGCGLGGLLGGSATGGLISGGLNDLLKQFQVQGQGDKARSWIGTSPNKPVTPHELEQALGEERIAWLVQEAGLSRAELLAGLSRELPHTVDKLTPKGRVPTEQELARMIR